MTTLPPQQFRSPLDIVRNPVPLHGLRLAIGLLIAALLLSGLAFAQTPPSSKPNTVLIVYDGATDFQAKGYIHALFIENLMGHFGLTGEIIPLAEYQPGQLAHHRAGFFIGVATNVTLPKALVDDVRATQNPFCWLGQHIETLVNTPEGRRQYGFSWVEYVRYMGVNRVIYKDTPLTKKEPDLSRVNILDQRGVQLVATAMTKQNATLPYVLRRNRFWYFADSPFAYPDEGGHYLAFCDLLHDILEIDHKPEKRALVRIEDVSVDQDPVDLKRVSDLLYGYKIPFQIALIPIFRNPSKELEVRISDRRSFADSVHYMIDHGATPVMHGVTHQYRGQSGDDYEFWDDTGDRAIAGDSAEFVQRRLQLGLTECFNAGIYPVAFEVPHYAASATDYRSMLRVFSMFYDRTISTPSLNSQQYFPYPVIDHWGRYVLPEDLGYVPIENPQTGDVLRAARSLRVVRDGVASFYFHPFLNPKLLDQIVRGIQDLGYHFVSIREFSSEVNYRGHYVVRTASGKAQLTPQNEYWRMKLFDRQGQLVDTKLSDGKKTGKVDIAVNVPPGGWAALDCLREKPVAHIEEPSVVARTRQWWQRLVAERTPVSHNFVSSKKAWILWIDKPPVPASHNQNSYHTVLDTFGYEVQNVKLTEFSKGPVDHKTIIVIPDEAGSRLTPAQQQEVLHYMSQGGRVVADGRQPWLEKVGVKWEDRELNVNTVSDQVYPEMYLSWRPNQQVKRFIPPNDILREFMVDTESDQLLAYADDYGQGYYLYLSVPFDQFTDGGTSHYPYFPKYLTDVFGSNSSFRSPRIEAYFDPSDRTAADYNRLAVQWRKSGIRTVYAAAWIFYPQWTFPYGEFVQACHRNGISVYAWIMLPEVTPKFWEDHPEWREKTATGSTVGDPEKKGTVGWRHLVNLQNPAAFRAAMDWMKKTLKSQNWDGVNIAELNYDADFHDFLNPERFVPMNDDVRADFRKKSGFDPAQLFQAASPYYHKNNHGALEKFLKYRENLVTDLHRRVLQELEPIRKERGWEIIVTIMDTLHNKTWRPALGMDSRRVAGLMKDFDFTLQVEDPADFWMKPPERYLRFAETYKKLVKDPKRLMFDINVVDRDIAKTNLPSRRATGVELARTAVTAASTCGRVAIYSEHSVAIQDWDLLRVALTRDSQVTSSSGTDWKVATAQPVLLTPAEDRDYYLDGRLWPAVSSDGVLAPIGRHSISVSRPWHHFLDPGAMPARLLSISADLLDARVMPTGVVLRYSSPGQAVAVFNQRPRDVLVDGHRVNATIEQAGADWFVTLPRGDHWAAVVTNTNAGVAVNLWGWFSASAINALGGIASILMVLIYFEIRLRRLVRRRA